MAFARASAITLLLAFSASPMLAEELSTPDDAPQLGKFIAAFSKETESFVESASSVRAQIDDARERIEIARSYLRSSGQGNPRQDAKKIHGYFDHIEFSSRALLNILSENGVFADEILLMIGDIKTLTYVARENQFIAAKVSTINHKKELYIQKRIELFHELIQFVVIANSVPSQVLRDPWLSLERAIQRLNEPADDLVALLERAEENVTNFEDLRNAVVNL